MERRGFVATVCAFIAGIFAFLLAKPVFGNATPLLRHRPKLRVKLHPTHTLCSYAAEHYAASPHTAPYWRAFVRHERLTEWRDGHYYPIRGWRVFFSHTYTLADRQDTKSCEDNVTSIEDILRVRKQLNEALAACPDMTPLLRLHEDLNDFARELEMPAPAKTVIC